MNDRKLVITRLFDATVPQVFEAWTQPEFARQWWLPKGFAVDEVHMDVRVGGRWEVRGHSTTDGKRIIEGGAFRRIERPHHLEFTHRWLTNASSPGVETLVRVAFTSEGSRTRMTFEQGEFESAESCNLHELGWSSCLSSLVDVLEWLANQRELISTAKAFIPGAATRTVVGDRARAELEIRTLIAAWSDAIARRDIEGIVANHANDVLMFDVPLPVQSQGLDAYRSTWVDTFFPVFGSDGNWELSDLSVNVGDDVAYAHGRIRCRCSAPNDQDLSVRLTVGLRKVNGDWLITHEHHSIPVES